MKRQYKLGVCNLFLPGERDKVDAALKANPLNEYTGAILDHSKTRVIKAYDGSEEHYLPVQEVLMLESISANIPPHALRDLVKGATLAANSSGIKEIYFLDGAGGIGKFAENHGFELLNYRVFRMEL